ncbi:hypothetical protein N7455_001062 [Penicillium solitum]|uniref:uncharacterized protein n=1 Tax=Penicillium solitum TaxID=60172 RepID=UPI0032C408CD|nr:hypothetical protein N7455_001062 [Penicillium solitum]
MCLSEAVPSARWYGLTAILPRGYPSDVQHGPTEGSWPDVYQELITRDASPEFVFGNETTKLRARHQGNRTPWKPEAEPQTVFVFGTK